MINDPSAAAWLIVASYALAAAIAWSAARSAAADEDRRFWIGAVAVLVALGVNKQLDLHTALTDWLREVARAGGWYGARRALQGLFLLLFAAGVLALAAALAVRLRGQSRSVKAAAAGILILILFIAARAASFHHLDMWLRSDLGPLRRGWWIELVGIWITAGAALPAALRARAGDPAV